MWLRTGILAIQPRDRRPRRNRQRIRMEREIADRDDEMRRVDDRDRHAAFTRDSWPRAPLRETSSAYEQEEERRSIRGRHGCLTTTTPFMNGCGVQWKEYSPGCVNVWLHVFPGSIGPESHDRSSAVIVWTS